MAAATATTGKLFKSFHGRSHTQVDEFVDTLKYEADLEELGKLVDIELDEGITLTFYDYDEFDYPTAADQRKMVKVCSNPEGDQYHFVGGNQEWNLKDKIFDYLTLAEKKKQFVLLGQAVAISYFTDKRHLMDRGQEEGLVYRHPLGEDGGISPGLVYDRLNKKIMFVGGTYETTPEGIYN